MDLLFSIFMIAVITLWTLYTVIENPKFVIFYLVAFPMLYYVLKKKTEPWYKSIRIASMLNFILIVLLLVFTVTYTISGKHDADLKIKEKLWTLVNQEMKDFGIIDIHYIKREENIYDVSVYAEPGYHPPEHYGFTRAKAYSNFKEKYGVQFNGQFATKWELFPDDPVPRFTVDLSTNRVIFAGIK